MKRTILILLIFVSLGAIAQQKTAAKKSTSVPVRNLHVGEDVPDIFIAKVINDEKKSYNISDFKDKLLIIDFWATGCKGCVAALPRMDVLQKQFAAQVKILPVTPEPAAFTSNFLKHDKSTKNIIVPSVVEDKILSKWFRYRFISHEVWIYKGKVAAITEPDYVTAENIKLVLSGIKNEFPVKDDMLPEFNSNTSFMQVNDAQYNWRTGPVQYAAIFGHRDFTGAVPKGSGFTIDSTRHTIRNYFLNFSIPSAYMLYWEAIRHPGDKYAYASVPQNRFIYEVRDTSRFLIDPDAKTNLTSEEWHRKYQFCFESVQPYTNQSEQEQAKAAISDLDHLLKLHGRWEKRKVKCWVITQKVSDEQVKVNVDTMALHYVYADDETGRYHEPPKTVSNIETKTAKQVMLTDRSLYIFYDKLSKKIPFVVEATYKGKILIPFPSFQNMQAFKKALQDTGFDLTEGERETEMFVFTDAD